MKTFTVEEGNQNLLKLAAFLETVPEGNFYYGTWSNAERIEELSIESMLKEPSCGTTACALGWACMMPEFEALGLKFSVRGLSPEDSETGDSAEFAGQRIFCLNDNESYHLFIPAGDDDEMTAKEVAARIRKLVADRGLGHLEHPEDDYES